MSETTLPTGQVTWLKDKHSRPKDKGRYKGGTSAGGKVKTKRKKLGGGPQGTVEHVKLITGRLEVVDGKTIIVGSGRVAWTTRPREVRR